MSLVSIITITSHLYNGIGGFHVRCDGEEFYVSKSLDGKEIKRVTNKGLYVEVSTRNKALLRVSQYEAIYNECVKRKATRDLEWAIPVNKVDILKHMSVRRKITFLVANFIYDLPKLILNRCKQIID